MFLGKKDFVGADFVGVRSEESVKRADYTVENISRKQKGQHSHNAILEWNAAEVWIYIFMRKLIINETYKKGNARAGCLFCPMSSGKANFFRNLSYPAEVGQFVNLIRDAVTDENIDSYINNGGWNNRRSGRDLVAPLKNYSEETRGDFFYITITNPKTDWREWIKTLGEVPFTYEVKEADNVVTVKVDDYYNRVGELRNFKAVFHKAAACIGCGVCESNCQFGAISFKDGLHIENCRHCLQCHDIDFGCLLYNSARFFLREGYSMKSFNTFGDHAPKPEWLNAFFDKANEFFKVNSLGPNQIVYFKRFLSKNQIISRRDLGRKSNRLQRRI